MIDNGQSAIGTNPLTGRAIVVTRPLLQAEGLAAAIRDAGGEPILFPTIEIREAQDAAALDSALSRVGDYAWAFFVSPNAVDKTFARIDTWPGTVRVAAVGPGTRDALKARGVGEVTMPAQQFDSEGLMQMPEFANVAGTRCVIFRGNGGREFIASTLTARGAAVDLVECYRRVMPALDAGPLLERWASGDIDALTLTSSEGTRNFVAMTAANDMPVDAPNSYAYFAATPVFVPHVRIAAAARSLGFRDIIATGAADAGLLAALCERFGPGRVPGKQS